MRAQEATWPDDKRETAEEFKARLRKTAMGLPEALVTRCVGDMAHRCRETFARAGKLFAEGRKSARGARGAGAQR